MKATFIATAKMLMRTPALIAWALAFPIVLSTIFVFMFASLDEADEASAVPVAVVADDAYEASPFSQVVNDLDGDLLAVVETGGQDSARDLVQSGEVAGAYAVDADGHLVLIVSTEPSVLATSRAQIDATILQSIADSYAQSAALARDATVDPSAMSEATVVGAAQADPIETVSLTHSDPRQTVRYYYALLGMAVLLTSNVAMMAVCRLQPNLSALGARRTVGSLGRGRALAATTATSWVLTFACLVLAFLYIRFVLGVDFGGREGLCMVAIAIGAVFATALGSMVGAIPRLPLDAKSGILAGVACFASLFAGLYGQPCMELADAVARTFPVLAMLNPARAVTDVFYGLYSYDSLDPFFARSALLAVFAAVLFAVAAVLVRRQRYEHL